jgi:protein gp37
MGVSVENDAFVSRIAHLKETKAAVKFISFEPLLGSVGKLNLKGIDWVIVGGESGPNARHVDESWVIDICSQCQRAGVPFFFKQWGGRRKKLSGRVLSGRTWDEYPALEMAR